MTLYVWPRPARAVTRLCANAGITPNQVTSLSLVLVLAAMALFWTGHYALGLVAAWVMTFLDTVDGKLARVTLRSSPFGNFYDHLIDLIHPPFWWWAWIVGLPAAGFTLASPGLVLTVIVAGYVLQRIEEGVFIACFGIEMHIWQRFDSRFRLITARRNPNLLLLTASVLVGRPDLGIVAVAVWTAAVAAGPCAAPAAGGAGAAARQAAVVARGADMSRAAGVGTRLLGAELERGAVPAPVTALAAELAARAGEATAAVLFYGSALRDGALDGVLDFYVLTDRPIAWPGSRLTVARRPAAAAERRLPRDGRSAERRCAPSTRS